ncbi:MAG TPA: ABC-type transport auxiliary lipoprotein family protein [Allosphingosinicella sp.]|jgi:cholesterol transport system auxiliary component
MTAIRTSLAAAALAILLPLAGCSLGGKAPPQLLTIAAATSRPVAQPRRATQGHVITVTSPTVPRAIGNTRLAVYVNPTTLQYLKDGVWADRPNELFRQLLSDTIAARSDWVVVDPSVYTQVQGVVLGGQLLRFGYDPNASEAVVLFEASLARPDQAVATNRFEARVPVGAADAIQVAAALNQASNQVAAQVADWVG